MICVKNRIVGSFCRVSTKGCLDSMSADNLAGNWDREQGAANGYRVRQSEIILLKILVLKFIQNMVGLFDFLGGNL